MYKRQAWRDEGDETVGDGDAGAEAAAADVAAADVDVVAATVMWEQCRVDHRSTSCCTADDADLSAADLKDLRLVR